MACFFLSWQAKTTRGMCPRGRLRERRGPRKFSSALSHGQSSCHLSVDLLQKSKEKRIRNHQPVAIRKNVLTAILIISLHFDVLRATIIGLSHEEKHHNPSSFLLCKQASSRVVDHLRERAGPRDLSWPGFLFLSWAAERQGCVAGRRG